MNKAILWLQQQHAWAVRNGMFKLAATFAVLLMLAINVSAQTNTISGISTELTSSLGTAYDTAIGIGVLAVGIGLVVYLIRKGVKVRG